MLERIRSPGQGRQRAHHDVERARPSADGRSSCRHGADEPNYLARRLQEPVQPDRPRDRAGLRHPVAAASSPSSSPPASRWSCCPSSPAASATSRYVRARDLEEAESRRGAAATWSRRRCCSTCRRPSASATATLQALAARDPRSNYKGHRPRPRRCCSTQLVREARLPALLLPAHALLAVALRRLLRSHRPRAHPGADGHAGARDGSGPERVQQIKARTRAVLEKRLERYKKAVENRELIDAQTETVQEVLQLLRDQSYSMRDPRSITEQLDGLVSLGGGDRARRQGHGGDPGHGRPSRSGRDGLRRRHRSGAAAGRPLRQCTPSPPRPFARACRLRRARPPPPGGRRGRGRAAGEAATGPGQSGTPGDRGEAPRPTGARRCDPGRRNWTHQEGDSYQARASIL